MGVDFILPTVNDNTREITDDEALEIANNFIRLDTDNTEVQKMIKDKLIEKFPFLNGDALEKANVKVRVAVVLERMIEAGELTKIDGLYTRTKSKIIE